MQWAACSVYFGTGPCSIFATHLSKLQMHALGLPPYLWLGPNWPCSFSMPSPHANWFSVTHLWLLKLLGPHHPRATKFSTKQKAMQTKNNKHKHRNLSMLSLLHTSMIFFHNEAEHLLLLWMHSLCHKIVVWRLYWTTVQNRLSKSFRSMHAEVRN